MTLPDPVALPPGYLQRNWTAQDIDAVVALAALVFGPDRWSAQIFQAEFAASNRSNPHSYYQLITYHDTVVGFCALAYGPPFADITTIWILPVHTGKQLGVAPLAWLIRTAYAHRAQEMLLAVRADDRVALRLYAANGFDHSHTPPRYYPMGIDAWVMRKRLREPGPSSAANLSTKEERDSPHRCRHRNLMRRNRQRHRCRHHTTGPPGRRLPGAGRCCHRRDGR